MLNQRKALTPCIVISDFGTATILFNNKINCFDPSLEILKEKEQTIQQISFSNFPMSKKAFKKIK